MTDIIKCKVCDKEADCIGWYYSDKFEPSADSVSDKENDCFCAKHCEHDCCRAVEKIITPTKIMDKIYRVWSRDYWDDSMANSFGESNSLHALTDAEVINAIMTFGRAQITIDAQDPSIRALEFQNGYD